MNSTRTSLSLALALAAISPSGASLTVYDTFGPSNSFNQGVGWTIAGVLSQPGFISQGMGFTAQASGPGLQLDIAMGHVEGDPARVRLQLFADNGSGQISGAIGNTIFLDLNPGSFGSSNVFHSVSLAGQGWNFTQGNDYWLVAEAPATVWLAWNLNDQNITGRLAFKTDPIEPQFNYVNDTHGAFRITAVPEPASLLALGAGLAALLARRRRSA